MYCESEVLERLGYEKLPRLPADISRLLMVLSDETTSFPQLASTIELYPDIAARLIAIANSAWSSPTSEITTLEGSCSRLGFDIVRNICIALAVAAPFNPKSCPGFSCKYFWTTSLLCADAASWLAAASSAIKIEPATARTAGMMHNLGILLLADQLPIEVHESIKLMQKGDYQRLGDALQFMLGFNHCDVGRILGKSWKLPDVLTSAMSYQIIDDAGNHSGSADLLRLTTLMVSSIQQDTDWSIPDKTINRLSLTTEVITDIYQRIIKQLDKTEQMSEDLFGRY